MTISIVLADANILFWRTLRDYFIYLADAGAIEIRWSQPILDEMSRNLRTRLGLDSAATDRLEFLMNEFVEHALIEIDPAHRAAAAGVEMDTKDRHVLAAAVAAEADVLLTANVKHFPREWMSWVQQVPLRRIEERPRHPSAPDCGSSPLSIGWTTTTIKRRGRSG